MKPYPNTNTEPTDEQRTAMNVWAEERLREVDAKAFAEMPVDMRVSEREQNEEADSPFGRGMYLYLLWTQLAIGLLFLIGYFSESIMSFITWAMS